MVAYEEEFEKSHTFVAGMYVIILLPEIARLSMVACGEPLGSR